METITVIKLNLEGREAWRYSGQLIARQDSLIQIEAFFDREDRLFFGMPLHKGDRFLETYYTNRWYNVFEIFAREDGRLRGWYCNVAQPAQVNGNTVSYVDLALDLLVFPDGRQLVLDEDEFTQLKLDQATRAQAVLALAELQQLFQVRS